MFPQNNIYHIKSICLYLKILIDIDFMTLESQSKILYLLEPPIILINNNIRKGSYTDEKQIIGKYSLD